MASSRLSRSISARPSVAAAAAILVVAATVGTAALFTPGVQKAIFDRGAQAQAAAINAVPLTDDAMRIAICGSSAPLPSERRAKACAVVFAGGKFYVVDSGPESTENLVL